MTYDVYIRIQPRVKKNDLSQCIAQSFDYFLCDKI